MSTEIRRGSVAAVMADPAAQSSAQPRLQQAQSSGPTGSNPNPGAGSSDPARPGLSQQQWSSQKKAQVRSFPRAKKLEKLGVFSSCKVTESSPHNNGETERETGPVMCHIFSYTHAFLPVTDVVYVRIIIINLNMTYYRENMRHCRLIG